MRRLVASPLRQLRLKKLAETRILPKIKTEIIPVQLLEWKGRSEHLAIVFPGAESTCDRTLLYYCLESQEFEELLTLKGDKIASKSSLEA
jgi:hypothetical protein